MSFVVISQMRPRPRRVASIQKASDANPLHDCIERYYLAFAVGDAVGEQPYRVAVADSHEARQSVGLVDAAARYDRWPGPALPEDFADPVAVVLFEFEYLCGHVG